MKTYLLAFAMLLASCGNLPTNPTANDIATAQDRIVAQQLAYSLVTTPVIANLKGENRAKAIAADAIVQQAFATALADAAAGRNVNRVELMQVVVQSERAILGLQAPTTQPN